MFEHRYKEEKDNVAINNTTPSKKDTKNTQDLEENTSLESNNNLILNDDKPLKIETWTDIYNSKLYNKIHEKYDKRKAYQYAFAYIMQKYCLYYDEKAGKFEIDYDRLKKEFPKESNKINTQEKSIYTSRQPTDFNKRVNQIRGAVSYYNRKSIGYGEKEYKILGNNWAAAQKYGNGIKNGSLSDIRNRMSEHDPEYGMYLESAKNAKKIQDIIAQGPQKEEKEIEIDDQNISFLDVMELTLATVGVVTSFATMEMGIGMASIGFALDGFQATAQKLIDKYNNVYKSSTTYEIGKLVEKKIWGTTIIYDSTNMFFALRSVKNGSIALFKGKPPTDKTVIDGLVNKMNASTFYIPQYVENHISKFLPSKDGKIITTRKIKK